MTDKSGTDAEHRNKAVTAFTDVTPLSGLFHEMQALMAIMPGAGRSTDAPLSTEEETEAMFDNMPV